MSYQVLHVQVHVLSEGDRMVKFDQVLHVQDHGQEDGQEL